MNAGHCHGNLAEKRVRRFGKFGGRSIGSRGWLGPTAILAMLPKCPACLAAYIALATGVGLSADVAARLRAVLIAVSVASLVFVAWRTYRASRQL